MSADRLSAALAGRYRIERELGAGGMATVYLAFDEKHDRKVAIKVLKPELAAVLGAERFVVEIKTTAAMSHPHILPLFDSGTADGFLFYVMPYIQGETIREKLNRETQFGVDEAVRIAREVADALDYAHRHGVIHRDIKPENILLHDGRAMVMDFGIALAVSAAAGGRMTETGLSLGTPHYMSPEQATAEKEITGRSDQYSLASVLYEMLAGQPPHVGGAAQQVIMRIIADTARPVGEIRKNVPANVEAALTKALEKLSADRFETVKAFADALGNPAYTDATRALLAPRVGSSKTFTPAFAAVSAIATIAVLTSAWLLAAREDAAPQAVLRVVMELPDSLILARGSTSGDRRLALSPDGSRLVLVGFYTGEARTTALSRLYSRRRDQLIATALPGTEGAWVPFFNREGTEVGFTAAGSLKVVGFDGAPPRSVLDTGAVASAAFDTDGSIIAWMTRGTGLVRIGAGSARTISQLSTLDSAAQETIHDRPDPLPNGRGVIFTVRHRPTTARSLYDIAVLDLRSGKHRILVRGVLGRFVAGGYLLFLRADGTLVAAPFDQDRLVLTGEPVTLATDASPDLVVGEDGTMAYVPVGATARELVWSGRDGGITPVAPGWQGRFASVALSHDGLRVAVEVDDATGSSAVWVRRLDVGTTSKLTLGDGRYSQPSWFPDGRVTYIDETKDPFRVLAMLPDGNATADTVVRDARSMVEVRPSKDGRWVIYRRSSSVTGGADILARRVGDTASTTLVASPLDDRHPALSPDGRWLAYTSTRSGIQQVYVQSFPSDSVVRMVSTAGGYEPRWSHSGKELFFMRGAEQMMAVAVTTQPTFTFGMERALFSQPNGVWRSPTGGSWDLSLDDKRFLFVRSASDGANIQARERIVLVSNWFEELKRLVPRN